MSKFTIVTSGANSEKPRNSKGTKVLLDGVEISGIIKVEATNIYESRGVVRGRIILELNTDITFCEANGPDEVQA